MARSIIKGFYIDANLNKAVEAARAENSNKPIKTKSRASMIIPTFIGLNIAIHNGRSYVTVYITDDMIGMRLGEFAPTRTFKSHSGDRKS